MAKWLVKGTYTVRYHIDTEVEAASSDAALKMALDDVEHDDPDDTETGDIAVEPIDAEALAAQDNVDKWRRWFTDWLVFRAGPFVTDGKAIAVLDDAAFDVLGDVVVDTIEQAPVEGFLTKAVAGVTPSERPCDAVPRRVVSAGRRRPADAVHSGQLGRWRDRRRRCVAWRSRGRRRQRVLDGA